MGTHTPAEFKTVHARLDELEALLPPGGEATDLPQAISDLSAATDALLVLSAVPHNVGHDPDRGATITPAVERLDRGCIQLEEHILRHGTDDPVLARAILAVITAASCLALSVLDPDQNQPLARTA